MHLYIATCCKSGSFKNKDLCICLATLFERGRHAGYLVLTGPDGREHAELSEMDPVILTKRKIKGDVPDSTVLRVGAESAVGEKEVKEAFYRLRFSDALF